MTHQVHVPRFSRDGAFELEEWCDPGQSIDIMASLDGKRYGDDHLLLQVREDASRRARQRDGGGNGWDHLSDHHQRATPTQKEAVERHKAGAFFVARWEDGPARKCLTGVSLERAGMR
jgi:hypothetical protein